MILQLTRCTHCDLCVFPARFLCPACGGATWRAQEGTQGRITEWTLVRARIGVDARADDGGPVHLASVETDAGPVVIARIDAAQWSDEQTIDGARVALTIDETQRIHARRLDRGE
ncbi:hypothetical protein [Robbsia sp. KACC 23696]|uniref:Zn-ribbon domain-containing OB-fold protein n=1 Tax=Robbsia sp. KACC 23696 TaxID=3149231 RepID=UPI00325ADB31